MRPLKHLIRSDTMQRYDIAIIGTGPAGLEAAITAKARNKNIILIGKKNLSLKIEKAHTIKNYLGLPDVSGEAMQQAFANHLADMDISITEDRVSMIYAMGEYFAIQGLGVMYEAKSVILACGVSTVKPFPGEMENLGNGVSYCATCDAALYRGRSAIVLGYSAEEEAEAGFLAEIADKVFYLPMYQSDITTNGSLEVIKDVKPSEIVKTDTGMMLKYNDGEELKADGIFILRDSVAPSQLVPGLKMEDNKVPVDRSMKTNIAGLFACGDITGAPYQYIKAAGEGNVAALSAVRFIS